jgi:predicted ferric reductase
MGLARSVLIWCGLLAAISVPIVVAAMSPLLAWRDPVYIAAGFAGTVALALVLVQPLLVGGYLPGLAGRRGRRMHRFVGISLIGAVILHVGALWVTSPPDVIDALLLVSPTPFSVWGVIAMWALFAAALLAGLRPRLRLRTWRAGHTGLVAIVVGSSVAHSMLVEGTMGTISKAVLCALALGVTAKVLADLRVWTLLTPRRTGDRGGMQ